MTDLKPCPFCKSEVTVEHISPDIGGPWWILNHPKNDCFLRKRVMFLYANDLEVLVDEWNRRDEE